MELITLPDEVLIEVFTYLKIVDKRSCRLVCKKWHACCECSIITQTEKFVFHSLMYSSSEVNKFLQNLERRRIDVEFILFDLLELNFALFGEKIEELEMDVYCLLGEQRETLKNVFLSTPNMTSLKLNLEDEYSFSELSFDEVVRRDQKFIVRQIIDLLRQEKFLNANLEKFDFSIYKISEQSLELTITISHLISVFPSLKEVFFRRYAWVVHEDKEILPKTDIIRLCGRCEVDFDEVDEFETFAVFSRLKYLNLSILPGENPSAVSLCDKLFSQTTAIEDLSVHVKTEDQDLTKAMLFQILTYCSKLTCLIFSPSNSSICLSGPDEIEKLFSLMSKLRTLKIPRILVRLDCGQPKLQNGRLKSLYINEEVLGPLDLHPTLLYANQLTDLHLQILEPLCTTHYDYITTILRYQKRLHQLTIYVNTPGNEGLPMDLIDVTARRIRWKHDGLKHLKLLFSYKYSYKPDHLINWLSEWEFPRLEMFELFTPSDPEFEIDPFLIRSAKFEICWDLRDHYMIWLRRLSTLSEIDIGLSFLNFNACVQICRGMRNLKKIVWRRPIGRLESEEVINIFTSLPNLRFLLVCTVKIGMSSQPDTSIMVTYQYCRSKKKLVHY